MDKRTEQLFEIRATMRGLADRENPTPQAVFIGLLVAIDVLTWGQDSAITRLACEIHGDAQVAWRKANPLPEPAE